MTSEAAQAISEMTADIVAAYVSHNQVTPDNIAGLIVEVHKALTQAPQTAAQPTTQTQEPSVPIKRSITKDHIVCLEDGKQFKSMKRHLRNEHGITPEQYREKWSLPRDYPMVAPNYAEARSALARSMGLGRKPGASSKKKSPGKRSR